MIQHISFVLKISTGQNASEVFQAFAARETLLIYGTTGDFFKKACSRVTSAAVLYASSREAGPEAFYDVHVSRAIIGLLIISISLYETIYRPLPAACSSLASAVGFYR
ncbi:hypothetical protein [Pollutimonas subterranea]|uniref:hypothetical protein n=1 Tax=Pollutimonas subterranea TaxID=2045210 RepID=UPI0011808C06|nr:hypothetical protein [Pollutimonas subterranea]